MGKTDDVAIYVPFREWLNGVSQVLEEKYLITLNDTKDVNDWAEDFRDNLSPLEAVDAQMERHDVPDAHTASGAWGRPPEYEWDTKVVERKPQDPCVPGEMFKTVEQLEAQIRDKGLVLYGSEEHKKLPAGMYLGLFHGFNKETYDHDKPIRDDWGAQGPVIGPLKYAHTTFATHVKLGFMGDNEEHVPVALQDVMGSLNELEIVDECVLFDGIAYGDWTVFHHQPK